MTRRFIIGSRGSKLALWQAEWVRSELRARGAEVEIEVIKTEGDVVRDVPLTIIGGLGVFTKEIEQALLDRRVDIAVHSLKDLPTMLAGGLALAAITEREDVRDALILRSDLAENQPAGAPHSVSSLPRGARVGTSSPRRIAQVRSLRPDVEIKDLRGNVDTRLRKLDDGEYEAIILASAGLRRLGLAERITAPIPVEQMLPAVGQGALGIETREDDEEAERLVAGLNHAATRAACLAERSLLRSLGGGCQLPIAGHARFVGDSLRLEGLVAEPSGGRIIRDSLEGPAGEAEALGERLSALLAEGGALTLLSASSA
jgi:hydroxymethylbilane synthase